MACTIRYDGYFVVVLFRMRELRSYDNACLRAKWDTAGIVSVFTTLSFSPSLLFLECLCVQSRITGPVASLTLCVQSRITGPVAS